MSALTIAVLDIARFSSNGLVYRAFDHLIAQRWGALLLVPVRLALGDMKAVVDRCPVPIGEVVAILDRVPQQFAPEVFAQLPAARLLTAFAPAAEWGLDRVALHPQARASIIRAHHESGLRYAEPLQ